MSFVEGEGGGKMSALSFFWQHFLSSVLFKPLIDTRLSPQLEQVARTRAFQPKEMAILPRCDRVKPPHTSVYRMKRATAGRGGRVGLRNWGASRTDLARRDGGQAGWISRWGGVLEGESGATSGSHAPARSKSCSRFANTDHQEQRSELQTPAISGKGGCDKWIRHGNLLRK